MEGIFKIMWKTFNNTCFRGVTFTSIADRKANCLVLTVSPFQFVCNVEVQAFWGQDHMLARESYWAMAQVFVRLSLY